MCQNIFKNTEAKQRKEAFTRLFVTLAANSVKETRPAARKTAGR